MPDINGKSLWPGWETVRLIGRGSFGAVYEIERDVFGEKEKAAMKVISLPQNGSDINEMYNDGYDEESITSTFKEHLKSIVAEYSLMHKLNGSANVVSCDDVRYIQHDDGIGWDIFIKMELLTPLVSSLPPDISDELVIKIGKDLCRALVQCKQFDIVHRDIKPQNIFVSPLGDYKLGDFGIAKTVEKTCGGTKIGTYKYMAPEIYNNQPYGARADIYSLGLVLYWLLNEKRMPFLPLPPEKLRAGLEEQARLRRFNGEPLPPPAHGSNALKQIVLKACAYDPKMRYQSANEMLYALETLGSAAESEKLCLDPFSYVEDNASAGCGLDKRAQLEGEKAESVWKNVQTTSIPKAQVKRSANVKIIVCFCILFLSVVVFAASRIKLYSSTAAKTGSPQTYAPVYALTPSSTPIPTPTPKPTATPKPTVTPKPSPSIPSAVANMDSSIQQPSQSSFLPNYSTQTKYIQSHHGSSVYLRFNTQGDIDKSRTVKEAEMVTVYAYQSDCGLVQTSDGRMGWVSSKFLVDSYYPYYQSLNDGFYLATIKSANKPGGICYVATIKILYAEGDRAINKEYRLRISDYVEIFDEMGCNYCDIKQFLKDHSSNEVTATIMLENDTVTYIDAGYDW